MKSVTHKNIVLVLVAIFMTVLTSSVAMAGAGAIMDVAHTVHNLGSAGGKVANSAAGINEVCVFCHTPHSSLANGPLWNKSNKSGGATPFAMYTSSSTLSNAAKNATLTPGLGYNSPSLLCLTCHDGKTAMNVLHNTSIGKKVSEAGLAGYDADDSVIPSIATLPYDAYLMPEPGYDMVTDGLYPDMRIGLNDSLTDDHPIGFSYNEAYIESLTSGGGLKSPVEIAASGGVRFFGSEMRMECSSCHNPHVNYGANALLKPFLVKSNARSALCTTCHDK